MRHAPLSSTHSHRWFARLGPALLLSVVLVGTATVAAAPPAPAANAAVITTWNQHAVARITFPAGSPTNFNYFAFVHLAMYNAVVGITGEYELYRWDKHAPSGASPEAAAAAAAHRVLVHYFGTTDAIVTDLNNKLAASLALVPDGGAQDKGVSYGVKAADRIIALRTGDGRNAAVTVPTSTAPGHWRPEPETALFGSAWLGGVGPLAVESATQFAPKDPPPPINSQTYVDEFNEVRDFGQFTSAFRTSDQTTTALFFSDAGIGPMQGALRGYATRHALDIDDSARMFAAADTAIADGAITVWNAKLQHMWWRPITAIRNADADGNDATASVPGWTPRIGTPPYPDYPSGLCSVVGAVSTTLDRLNGNNPLDLRITSAAAGGITRTFDTTDEIAEQAVDARVWSGIHFRTADEVSIEIGSDVANYTLDNYFQPSD